MYKYAITTDQTADFPMALSKEDFGIIPMSYAIDGTIYDNKETPFLSSQKFYDLLANGKTPSTTIVKEQEAYDFFKKILDKGQDVLHISFSSAMSGCYQSYISAAQRLNTEYKENKVYVVDSLGASIGEGLLCYYALLKRDEGADILENQKYLNDLRHHIAHSFTVNDMFHLYRSGRITMGKAIVGNTIKLKTLITVSDKGILVPTNNVIGRKPAMKALVDKMEKNTKGYDNKLIIIGHADCMDDAKTLKAMVQEKLKNVNIVITDIGPIIGTHCGKGMLALVYLTKDRTPSIK